MKITNVELNQKRIISMCTDLMLFCLLDDCNAMNLTIKTGNGAHVKYHFEFEVKTPEGENDD